MILFFLFGHVSFFFFLNILVVYTSIAKCFSEPINFLFEFPLVFVFRPYGGVRVYVFSSFFFKKGGGVLYYFLIKCVDLEIVDCSFSLTTLCDNDFLSLI